MGRRIDLQVGEQAILGRDRGQHPGGEAFGTRLPDRLMGRVGKHAGMPVDRQAGQSPRTDGTRTRSTISW